MIADNLRHLKAKDSRSSVCAVVFISYKYIDDSKSKRGEKQLSLEGGRENTESVHDKDKHAQPRRRTAWAFS